VWSFQLAHLLDQADLSTAEGRDGAFAPTLAILADAPHAVREELIADAASRLGIEPAVIASGLNETRRSSLPATVPPPPVRPISQSERAECVFLSLCLALGNRGTEYLERSRPEHFATDLMRRAREHLVTHQGDPLAGLPPDDVLFASAVMEIVQMADEGEVAEHPLRLSYLQLELRRVERALRTAEQCSDFERQRFLWGQRESVRGEISELMGQTA
jgi:hypothetical protein